MKIYIYFSKNKISKINDVNFVKESIARSITEAFSLFETFFSKRLRGIIASFLANLTAMFDTIANSCYTE